MRVLVRSDVTSGQTVWDSGDVTSPRVLIPSVLVSRVVYKYQYNCGTRPSNTNLLPPYRLYQLNRVTPLTLCMCLVIPSGSSVLIHLNPLIPSKGSLLSSIELCS